MPEDIKNQPTSRFYLRPLTNPASSVWYSHLPIGKNTIRKMMKSIASLGELELEGRKTNHSTRKTFATDLLDADIPNTELEVTQLGDMLLQISKSRNQYQTYCPKHFYQRLPKKTILKIDICPSIQTQV
jgi:hypothetical protein